MTIHDCDAIEEKVKRTELCEKPNACIYRLHAFYIVWYCNRQSSYDKCVEANKGSFGLEQKGFYHCAVNLKTNRCHIIGHMCDVLWVYLSYVNSYVSNAAHCRTVWIGLFFGIGACALNELRFHDNWSNCKFVASRKWNGFDTNKYESNNFFKRTLRFIDWLTSNTIQFEFRQKLYWQKTIPNSFL